MIKIKNNWNDITIAEYKAIVKAMEEHQDDMEKNVAVIAILAGVEEETIWNLQIGEIQSLVPQLEFIKDFDFPQDIKLKKITIGDYELIVNTKMNKFSVAQYVDFQNYWSQEKKDLAKVLSIFLIPKGCKYNEGYDIVDLINVIENNVSLPMANGIAFFLLKKSLRLTSFSTIFLRTMVRIMAKRAMKDLTPDSKKKEMKRERIKKIKARLTSIIGLR